MYIKIIVTLYAKRHHTSQDYNLNIHHLECLKSRIYLCVEKQHILQQEIPGLHISHFSSMTQVSEFKQNNRNKTSEQPAYIIMKQTLYLSVT